jgi:hypothetical protein
MPTLRREIGKMPSARSNEQHQDRSSNHEIEQQDDQVGLPSQHIGQSQQTGLDHIDDGHGLIVRESKAKQFVVNVRTIADERRTALCQPLSGPETATPTRRVQGSA